MDRIRNSEEFKLQLNLDVTGLTQGCTTVDWNNDDLNLDLALTIYLSVLLTKSSEREAGTEVICLFLEGNVVGRGCGCSRMFLLTCSFLACCAAEMQDEVSDAMLKEVCITEQTQYYFENNQLSFRGNIDCENCTR